MKIIIFGSNGNLGEQLVKVFTDSFDRFNPLEQNEIIGWDKDDVDITDNQLVRKKISEIKPGLIINAVAYNAVDHIESDEGWLIAEKINILAVKNLVEAALDSGAALIHFSSDYVFSGENPDGYKEDDEAKPISKYGESKRSGEEAILKLSGKGLKWYLIRTSKLFGPKGSSKLVKPSFFELMKNISVEKNEIEVIDEEVSCFTYTIDLAQATKVLVDENYGYGIYHITNSKSATWYQAAKYFFSEAKINVIIKPISADKFTRSAKRPKHSILLNTKFIPMRSYEEAITEYLNT